MGHGVFLLVRQLGKRLVGICVRDEYRIVAETVGAGHDQSDAPVHPAFEEVLLTVQNQRDHGAEARAAGGSRPETGQFREKLRDIGLVIMTLAGISGRIHARGSPERLNLQTGIVSEAVLPAQRVKVSGFDS